MKTLSEIVLSVIVPIYNVDNYVEKCIVSILEQTYSEIEIILIDDGSSDRSSIICDEFAKKDVRIIVIHKENGGLVSARKAGVNIARGKYIISVDGDDWIERDRFKHLVNQISLFEADMIYLSGYMKDIGNRYEIIDSPVIPKTYLKDDIQKSVFPLLHNTEKCFESIIKGSLCMWAIKRELLQEKQNLVDDRISMSEDHICIWFCLLSAESVTIMKDLSYHYIQRPTSLTYSKTDEEHDRMKIWHYQLKQYIQQHTESKDIMKIFAFLNTAVILLADYEMLLLENSKYFFPYSKVVKGSKVIVYGAGKLGCHIIRAMSKRKDYEIALWVDKNEQRPSILNYRIHPVRDILEIQYDFILIAIFYEDMALEIKKSLLEMGIKEEKIALMDPNVIDESYLNEVFSEHT
ncbi:MAG: glycosyltransferase family 2 protein [Hungatella sp.]|nr:glycosyltransferase family 2 protein [Hungatella sp.]